MRLSNEILREDECKGLKNIRVGDVGIIKGKGEKGVNVNKVGGISEKGREHLYVRLRNSPCGPKKLSWDHGNKKLWV